MSSTSSSITHWLSSPPSCPRGEAASAGLPALTSPAPASGTPSPKPLLMLPGHRTTLEVMSQAMRTVALEVRWCSGCSRWPLLLAQSRFHPEKEALAFERCKILKQKSKICRGAAAGGKVCISAAHKCSPRQTQHWWNCPEINRASVLAVHPLWAGLGLLQMCTTKFFLLKTHL